MELSYKNLIVWQKSLELTKAIYLLTDLLPPLENFILKSQMRRAAISVSSNIAEGSGRRTVADKKHFYVIARSSLIELDSQIETCKALSYFKKEDCATVYNFYFEVFKILCKLIH
jgi:four helix bundle protein